jgi:hypothetical protein
MPTRSGLLAIAGMAMLGALLLVLLFLAPRYARRAPNAAWGLPPQAICAVVIDMHKVSGGIDAAAEEIRRIDPDLVLLQGIDGLAGEKMAAGLGFGGTGAVAFYPAQNLTGPNSTWGNMILSKHALYEIRSIPNRGGSFGVWAVAAQAGVKFYVASAEFSRPEAAQRGDAHQEVTTLLRAWDKIGHPPMLLGLRADSVAASDWGLLAAAGLLRTNASGTATAPADAPSAAVELLRTRGWQVGPVEGRVDGLLIVTLRAGG